MKICICDDELNILDYIKNILMNVKDQSIIISFSNVDELQNEIKENDIDILFMDIKINDINGIDFINQNKKYLKNTKLIYITGYDEYIEDTFVTDPIYVLRKPLNEDKIVNAYKKAIDKIKSEDVYILFKTAKETIRMKLNDILYIESKGRIIDIHTINGVKSIYYKLSDIEKEGSNQLERIHKSFLVNLNKIKIYKYNKLLLENEVELMISRTYQKSCKAKILSFMEENCE